MTPNRMDSAVYPVLARFFAAIEWWKLVPHPGLFADGIGGGETLNAAMHSTAGDRLPHELGAVLLGARHGDEQVTRLHLARVLRHSRHGDRGTYARGLLGTTPCEDIRQLHRFSFRRRLRYVPGP